MRIYLIVTTIILMLTSTTPPASQATEKTLPQKIEHTTFAPADIYMPRDGIPRTWEKLANDKKLTIAYFGGSITEGAGASDQEKTSWRALTTQWFRDQFPQATITAINAALGGTGSDLGAFRLQSEALIYKPDLIFVEFAVNDQGHKEDNILRSMEGIARHIRKALPQSEIVFVYTLTKSLARSGDTLPKPATADEQVAAHYGIPSVNIGRVLQQKIKDGQGNWESYTIDNVHPNDTGYQIYFGAMKSFLQQLREMPTSKNAPLPAPLTANPIENARLISAADLTAPGWEKTTMPEGAINPEWHPERYGTVLASNKPGAQLKYTFKGSTIGLLYLITTDSGDIEYSIDGSEMTKLLIWNHWAEQFILPGFRVLADNLAPGEHELRLQILPEKQEKSTGYWFRLVDFLVN